MNEPIYFGCVERIGHYCYAADLGRATWRGRREWVNRLDGLLPPLDTTVQGVATLAYIHGFSILAFWDRSVDNRPGSNSVFLIPGRWSFEETLERARVTFPKIFDRFQFEITKHSTVEATKEVDAR